MKSTMKIGLLLLALSSLFSGCVEEECNVLVNTILGTWTAPIIGEGDIQFINDSSFIDDEGLILDAPVNGIQLDNKTWALSGDTLLVVSVTDGTNTLNRSYEITAFDCDQIGIEFTGVQANFIRK